MDQWRLDLLVGLADLAKKLLKGTYTPKSASQKLQKLAFDLMTAESQRPSGGAREPKNDIPSAPPEVLEIFEYWRVKTRRPEARPTRARYEKIRARLEDGFSVAQLKSMIEWSSTNPHHQGDNDRSTRYDTIDTLFRSTERTETFVERARMAQGDLFETTSEVSDEVAELEEQAKKAREDGDTQRYNELQDRLRALTQPTPDP